jgi:hypothetical protein
VIEALGFVFGILQGMFATEACRRSKSLLEAAAQRQWFFNDAVTTYWIRYRRNWPTYCVEKYQL